MSRIVPGDAAGVRDAVRTLLAGGLVAFPTETVYGLGARARDVNAVRSVFRAKGRPADHPLIVHLPTDASLDDWAADVPQAARTLAARFWPGPLTLVLRRAPGVANEITGGQDTVALRTPSHPVAVALLRALGEPVVAPSANRFGRISPTRAEHVASEFSDLDLTVLDGGPCDVGLESTIVDLSGAAPALLRPGAVSGAELERALGARLVLPGELGPAVPRVPGRLERHYAPAAPTRLIDAAELRTPFPRLEGAALLLCRAPLPDGGFAAIRRLQAEPVAYGRELYAALRALDAASPSEVIIERPPAGEMWTAVHDRLARATGSRPGQDSGGLHAGDPAHDVVRDEPASDEPADDEPAGSERARDHGDPRHDEERR
ncbi:MAG: L-threonylcarbamoyladenylate synthase [Trueperaceae bacterium]|nr:L-threonylcarbamoyladenylate synthase [Trueperaceae bacterium]